MSSQENVLKILAGASKVARNSANILKQKGTQYIEQNIVKGNYVSREEFESLRKLVLKMEQQLLKFNKQSKD